MSELPPDTVDMIPGARIGDTLRAAREAKGLSLKEISQTLLINEQFLDAIERMYAGGVPRGYLNGILRSYAGHLGLQPDHVIKTFNEQCGAVSEAPKMQEIVEANERSRVTMRAAVGGFAAAVGIIVVGGIGYAVYHDISTRDPVEIATPVNGARASLFVEAETEELAPQLPLTLTATRTGWLEVRGADGTIFRSRNMAAGEVYHPRIGAGWTISAEDGGAFTWHLGDVEVGPLGPDATPVYAISVDAIAQSAAENAAPALAAVNEGQPSR